MALQTTLIIFILVNSFTIPCGDAAWPGTFFWKPRLGIDMTVPVTDAAGTEVKLPTIPNINDGYVVLINGYEIGITLTALAGGWSDGVALEHLNPMHAWFYTTAWRWANRHLSMMPYWVGGNGAQYIDSHKTWRRRFYYQDKFIPKWIQKGIFWVPASDWEREEKQLDTFVKYAEPAFGKHYRYPSPVFNNFNSDRSLETIENLDKSSNSISSRWNKEP